MTSLAQIQEDEIKRMEALGIDTETAILLTRHLIRKTIDWAMYVSVQPIADAKDNLSEILR